MVAYTFYENDNRVIKYAEVLAKRGDSVDVVSVRRKGQTPFVVVNGVRVHRIQRRVVDEKLAVTYLAKLLLFLLKSGIFVSWRHFRSPYDLIHIHSIPDFEVFAGLWAKWSGAKIILDIHDLVPELYASKFSTSSDSLLFKLLVWMEKISARFSDHVIVANDIWKERLISRSVSAEKCTTILNYPNTGTSRHSPISGEWDGKFVMLYPGTLNWHQGVDIAIKAFAVIKDKIPEAEFHIYGEGCEKTALVELTRTLGIEDRVLFKDLVPIDEISEIMAEAQIGVIPKRATSFANEAFSTKILEFMALGVVVVVSRTKIDNYYFNESMVKFFEPGNVEDLADSLVRLSEDRDLRCRLAKNALEYSETKRWAKKQYEYTRLVESLVGRNQVVEHGAKPSESQGEIGR